jgi:Reverse transcriptase (RNA-dependent DNA polymerase)
VIGVLLIELAAVISKRNLELAWRRIVTGRNLQHKRFFRHLYGGYELGLSENINLLHDRLNGNWHATPPTRIHLPKTSGLLRPITLLAIEDQIVLQAIANKVAVHVRARRRNVELKHVFSNCLERRANSIFFLQDWRKSYGAFQRQLQSHLESGHRWIAHFDLAAFYETISHRALRSIIAPRGGSSETWSRINQWLCVWSAGKTGVQVEHGIPQGPIASDFLAEVFLLPIDEVMKSARVKYIRYVDDIRVLAKTEKDARRVAIALELACRKWSLIPQSSKFIVERAKSLEDALGTLPSIVESASRGDDEAELDASDAERMMREALRGRPLKVVDKTRLRYVLYRAPPINKLLRRTLDLLPRHPEHIDAFMAYLSKYSHSNFIMDRVRTLLRDGVLYDYVEGELWQLAASIGKPRDLKRLLGLFKKQSKKKGRSMTSEWGLLTFAAASARADIYSRSSMTSRVRASDPYLQSLVISFLDEREFRRQGLVGKLLRQPEAEPGLVIVTRLLERNLTHRSFGVRPSQLAPQVRNAFQGVGLLPPGSAEKFDQIGGVLRDRFEIDYWRKWRNLFGSEYAHALSMLLSADVKYASDPSEWLSWQDSFNDALFKAMQGHLARLGLACAPSLTNKFGELIDYGVLLDPNQAFARAYPDIATPFSAAHARRNRLPTNHPYEKKTAKQTKYLKPKERNDLSRGLATAYREIIALLSAHL